jgi:hypothetical protein
MAAWQARTCRTTRRATCVSDLLASLRFSLFKGTKRKLPALPGCAQPTESWRRLVPPASRRPSRCRPMRCCRAWRPQPMCSRQAARGDAGREVLLRSRPPKAAAAGAAAAAVESRQQHGPTAAAPHMPGPVAKLGRCACRPCCDAAMHPLTSMLVGRVTTGGDACLLVV